MSYNVVFKLRVKRIQFIKMKKAIRNVIFFRGKQLPLSMNKEFIYNSYLSETKQETTTRYSASARYIFQLLILPIDCI